MQNKAGKEIAQNLPPVDCSLTHYRVGDVLVANIRPYLKKIWKADQEGGCSSDVLVFRAKDGHNANFLYAVLMQDAFFDYVMKGAKGSKMPRGDKDQIMRYEMPTFSPTEEENIGNLIENISSKISLNRSLNDNLEAMAKQLYDYWFVQFDFPNEEGKPYKSRGGKMAWNEKSKREIPIGWEVKSIGDVFAVKKGSLITAANAIEGEIKVVAAGINYSYLTGVHNRPRYTTTISGSGANAGYINFWREEIFASDCTTINGNDYTESIIGYYAAKLYQNLLFKYALGSAQPHVYPNQIAELPYVCIPKELIDKFGYIILPIQEEISRNTKEIQSLTKQRDELLPLLMNGQATINYHLSVLEVAANIGKFSDFIDSFSPSACRFEG